MNKRTLLKQIIELYPRPHDARSINQIYEIVSKCKTLRNQHSFPAILKKARH